MSAAIFDNKSFSAFIVACIVLLASNVGFQWAVAKLDVYLRKERIDMRRSFSSLSQQLGEWKAIGKDQIMDAAMIEELGTDKYLQRSYLREEKGSSSLLNLHLTYYTGMIDAVPHVPDRCMVAGGYNIKVQPRNLPLPIDTSGWRTDDRYPESTGSQAHWLAPLHNDFSGRTKMIPMPSGEWLIRTTEFYRDDQPAARIFGGYFFIANNRVTPTPEGVKAMAFRPSEKYAYYCKVQIVYLSADATEQKFLQLSADLLQQLLPELMERLPDWSQVEGKSVPASSEGSTSSSNTNQTKSRSEGS